MEFRSEIEHILHSYTKRAAPALNKWRELEANKVSAMDWKTVYVMFWGALRHGTESKFQQAAKLPHGDHVWSASLCRSSGPRYSSATCMLTRSFLFIFYSFLAGNQHLLVTGCEDKEVRVWDMQSSRLLRTLSGHSGPVYTAVFLSSGRKVISASADGTIRLWSWIEPSGSCELVIQAHAGSVSSLEVSEDGTKVYSAGSDDKCAIWLPH
jgi:WD40 repeat protein